MVRLVTADVFLFEDLRLDRRGGGLFRADERGDFAPVAIGSRALDILGVLLERPGDLVLRDELIAAVWPETVVEESNLTVQIAAIRRVLDQGRSEGSCIQTVAGRGYRFVVPVTRAEASGLPASGPSSANAAAGPTAERPEPRLPSASVPYWAVEWLRPSSIGLVAGTLCLLAVVVAASSWHISRPGSAGSATRLSIVVLPFANLGSDPEQQYFADGITDVLTTDLSRQMFVISHRTASTLRNKAVDARQIGRELGVRYLLEGSVQRSGNQVRVDAQLIDAATDTHLWADRFDRDMGDLFALQDEITARIATPSTSN